LLGAFALFNIETQILCEVHFQGEQQIAPQAFRFRLHRRVADPLSFFF
jgi:hypothetical protein